MSLAVRLALLGLFALAAAPALAQAPEFYGLRFPDRADGFSRSRVVEFEKEHPGLGYDVKYSAQGWVADVFIYDDGYKAIPDSLSADVVVKQFEQARGDIYTAHAKGNGKVEDKGRFTIAAPDKQVRFSCGMYLINDGRMIDSFLCLTVWHGKFVKYRLSTLSHNGSAAEAKRFVGAWTSVLWH